jgi:hypothetical protein
LHWRELLCAERFPDGLGQQASDSMQDCSLCSGNQVLVLISVRTNIRKPGINSIFDPRPEAGIVESDPAGVLFRLSKLPFHFLVDLWFFGFQELLFFQCG